MKIDPISLRRLALFGAAIGLCGIAAGGCHGTDDAAPTNTADSKYMGGGDTAADKIGADRAAAHRPRLPGKGAQGS